MDERKSWRWLIFAYSGVGIVVLAIGFFIARSAAHGGTIVAHADATATPSTIGVYSGIAPDATATPTPAVRPSPAPSASPSASASPAPSPSPRASAHATTPDPRAKLAAAPQRKHRKGHGSKLVASTGTSSDAAAQNSADDGGSTPERVVAPVHSAAPALAAQPAPTPAPTQAPAAASAPVIVAQAANEPIFAPERIVDAQVRVAVQPDESDADRERGAHGTSVILVTIDPKGNVVSAAVGTSSGYASLDRDALAAARASEFVPPKINGRAATETYRLVYDFGQ